MVSAYESRKNEVLALCETVEAHIKELQDYAKEIKLPDFTDTSRALIADIRNKLERVKENRFSIMIAGEAKSGKSTFINAYLGVELLPMDVKQCTSAIVKIKYGDTFSIKATYADGKEEIITGENEAQQFLKENAALDDEYRDIPVPTINSEILVKSGQRALAKNREIVIRKQEVEDMINSDEVKAANIHNLPNYNDKIKAYIEVRKNSWKDIVTEIEVNFPFGEDLRGIEIIDSPGVCARGGVAEVTDKFIEHADAIIFLKPISGQALESTQFNQFMKNTSVQRNKNALFLVLTRATNVTEADLRRLEEEAYKQFSNLSESNILIVDSKAELYAKHFITIDDIEDEIRRLKQKGLLDSFILDAFFDMADREDFIGNLKEKSRFKEIYNALETFGRKAHYILLESLLESIERLYTKLAVDMERRLIDFKQKAANPNELAARIGKIKIELQQLQNKMSKGVEKECVHFQGDDGIINFEVNSAVNNFKNSIKQIDPNSDDAFAKLEALSMGKIDEFQKLTNQIQKQATERFDKVLMVLNDKSIISYESLKPEFTLETFKSIKEETEKDGYEVTSYEEGVTFKKTHTYSYYSQEKHFKELKGNIETRIQDIRTQVNTHLNKFIECLASVYVDGLKQNADKKQEELDAIMDLKASAEDLLEQIKELSAKAEILNSTRNYTSALKGGISNYV